MARVVIKLWATLVGALLVLSLGMGSVVHAMEPVACVEDTAPASGSDHASERPAPADDPRSDPAMHAHNGCHGHHLATPEFEAKTGDVMLMASLRSLRATDVLAAIDPDRTLRPPIA